MINHISFVLWSLLRLKNKCFFQSPQISQHFDLKKKYPKPIPVRQRDIHFMLNKCKVCSDMI